jgi:hypothetical protein
MTENKETLKALSLIAAELHIQNLISIAQQKKLKVDHSYVSEEQIPKLADHFLTYFTGERFSPGSAFKFPTERK